MSTLHMYNLSRSPKEKPTYSGSFPCLSIKTWIWNSWFFFHFLDFSLYNRSSAPTTVSLAVTSLKSKKNVLSFSCLRCGTFLALKYKKNQNKDQIFWTLLGGGFRHLITDQNLSTMNWRNSFQVCTVFNLSSRQWYSS